MKDSRREIIRLGLVYAAYFASIAVIFPYLPIYLRLRGFSPSRIGLTLAAIEMAGVVSPFLLSRLADRSGQYRMVLRGMVLAAGATLYLLDMVSLFPLVLLMAFLNGLVYKPTSGIVDALTGRILKDPSANYGRVRVWGTISFIFISLVLQAAGIMDSTDTNRYISMFLMALGVVFIALVAVPAPPDSTEADTSRSGGLGSMPKGYFSLLALSLVGNIGFAIHQAFGSLYYSEILGVAAVSGLFALASFTEIPSLFYGGRILGFLGHRRMIFIALAAGAVRLVVLAMIPHGLPLYLSQLTHALSFGFFWIAGVNWVNRMVPVQSRALGMGLFQAATFSGAMLTGSAVGGFLLEWGGFPLLFGIGAGFPLIGMAWMLLDRRIGKID